MPTLPFKKTLWYGWGDRIECVGASITKEHPNDSVTFRITDPAFLEKTGWKPTSFVEVQAAPAQLGQVPRDKYVWIWA